MDVRSLVWWNRAPGPHASLWHRLGGSARELRIEEVGPACRLSWHVPPAVRATALLPPENAWLQHDGVPARLGASLGRLLQGARPVRVLAADAIDSPKLFAAAVVALRPDVTACAADLPGKPLLWPSLPGIALRCETSLRPALEAALRAADEDTPTPGRWGIEELALHGFHPLERETPRPLAWTGPGRVAGVLLPGLDGVLRIGLELGGARIPLDGSSVRLRVAGRNVPCAFGPGRLEITTGPLTAASCHVLEIAHDRLGLGHDSRPEGLALVAVAVAQ